MRTTLNLDDDAIAEALKVFPGKTKTSIINDALRDYARRQAQRELLKFEGQLHWDGNLALLGKRRDPRS
jgi:Arc/MetJ family transcription regulator